MSNNNKSINPCEFNQYIRVFRDEMVHNGKKECREMRRNAKGNMVCFYNGSIDGFIKCKKLNSLISIQDELHHWWDNKNYLFCTYNDGGGSKAEREEMLEQYWYAVGYITQLQFVYDRLLLFFLG